jgi:hypothetical protein
MSPSFMKGPWALLCLCAACVVILNIFYQAWSLAVQPCERYSTSPCMASRNNRTAVEYYSSENERDLRHSRFPSVQDRVKIYMGPWYSPPCEGNNAVSRVSYSVVNEEGNDEKMVLLRELARSDMRKQRTFVTSRQIVSARAIWLDWHAMMECNDNPYCADTKKYLLPALDRVDAKSSQSDKNIPTILQ